MKLHKSFALRDRGGRFSALLSYKTIWVCIILAIINIILAVISIGVGSSRIPVDEVIKTLFGYGSDTSSTIIYTLRLPRILIALLAGASLAVAGAILQGIIRNPLASPDIAGITGGATLGAVSFFYFLGQTITIHLLPIAAVIGAFIVSGIIYMFAWKGGVSPLRLVLIGIGMSTAMSSLTYMLLISGPIVLANKSLTFMTGSIYGVAWETDVFPMLPYVCILLPFVFLQARNINVQELGDDVAAGIGSKVQRQRLLLLCCSVALAGAAVAICGAVSFIGLMAPHIARKLVGPSFGGVLPVSALTGSFVLLLADLIARTAFSPLDIPAGVFTAAVGAPFFIYLLYKHRSR
ncbi:FecCD family ABC transporter permease [Paenibacillus thalictri]|uniref:Iron ABC transporter permease n=1 Tax=Paenibacillus thalictri TaxID=2527873 RepID=A0A4V2J497_9BACL|nr:iron ABC transporter permease [Paenibacillus thalictri]TBL78621.1 iron ABC transporter permease [Paenibacillus thalictri]